MLFFTFLNNFSTLIDVVSDVSTFLLDVVRV